MEKARTLTPRSEREGMGGGHWPVLGAIFIAFAHIERPGTD